MRATDQEPGGTGAHAWERRLPLWHALFIGLLALATALGIVESQLTSAELAVVAVVAAPMLAGYWAVFIRRHPWTNPVRVSLLYLVLVTVGWALLLRQSPTFLWLQLALISQVFFVLPMRWTVPVVFAIAAVGLQFDLSGRPGPVTDHLPSVLASLAITGFLVVFGAWIGTIIEQSEERQGLIEQLEATRRELAEQERLAGVQSERRRLAREIHDTLAQDLTAIIMRVRSARAATGLGDAAADLEAAERIATGSLAEARRIVWALRPTDLEEAGLVEAMSRVVGDWHPRSDLSASLVVTGAVRTLHPDLEITLLRATQEGLANVARHAGASRVTVTLSYLDDTVTLDIHDDGVGFAPRVPAPRRPESGFGLLGMRQRAERLGGSVAVESAPGEGTTIGIRLPAGTP